jgi:hypothetical protein
MLTRQRTLALFALGFAGSQAGHLLAYQMQFGAAAAAMQSSGPHAYFPTLAKTSLGAFALSLIGALLLVGVARIVSGRRPAEGSAAPAYVPLISGLFTIQLAGFAVQEVAEALLAGAPVPSAAHLLLWGIVGQLPVAAVAALAWRWLATRLEDAAAEVLGAFDLDRVVPPPVPVAVPVWIVADRATLVARAAGRSLVKRGPPSF